MDHEHLVVEDQLLGGADRRGGIATIILANGFDLSAVHAACFVRLLVDDVGPVHHELAVEIARAGQGAELADQHGSVGDPDLRGTDTRRSDGEQARGEQRQPQFDLAHDDLLDSDALQRIRRDVPDLVRGYMLPAGDNRAKPQAVDTREHALIA